jgi:uncharacterized protein with PCYCGC motif
MGRKSSAKSHTPPAGTPPEPKRSFTRPLVTGLVALALIVGGLLYWRQTNDRAAADVTQGATPAQAPVAAAEVPEVAKHPHQQATLPQLQFPAYPMAKSAEVVAAAYKFAAEHPEVLSYVPCFCGCEHSGHHGNEDCFVKARDVNADVIEWQEHGMECAVCLEVAQRSMQMHSSGASVRDIRATIEKEWAGRSQTHTPTPPAP